MKILATKIHFGIKEKIKTILKPLIYKIPNKYRYGKYYRDFYKNVDNFFNLSLEEKRKIQLKKIQEIVEYAYFNVPYYKELLDKNNISYKIKSFEDFEKIPYLTKDIIRNNLEKLKSKEKVKSQKVTTGGTTGMPMEFYLDKNVSINETIFVDYYWNKFSNEYKNTSKVAVLRGFIPSNDKKFERIGNKLIMSSFKLLKSNTEEYLKVLEDFNPDYLHVYPSSISLIAEYILQNNMEVNLPNLKGIFSGSETLTNYKKEEIEKAFKVKVSAIYGHSEQAVIAFNNIKNEDYTLDLLYGYTELIVDGKNIILNENKEGEIVVTSFWNKSMPFIRYKTGDNAISSGNYDSLKKISGRKSEYFIDKNSNKIIFTCSDEPFWNCKEKVDAYQYVQNEVGRCQLKMVKFKKFLLTENDEKEIKNELKRLYPNIEFYISYVENIERTKRGKYKYLVQNIKEV